MADYLVAAGCVRMLDEIQRLLWLLWVCKACLDNGCKHARTGHPFHVLMHDRPEPDWSSPSPIITVTWQRDHRFMRCSSYTSPPPEREMRDRPSFICTDSPPVPLTRCDTSLFSRCSFIGAHAFLVPLSRVDKPGAATPLERIPKGEKRFFGRDAPK
jgi:hypothetical protein